MPSVKYAISAYVADGTTTDYLITWDYLDEDHIAVYVDGTSNADPTASHTFSKLNDTTLRITDELGNAIASGAEIEIRRETPLTTRAITFADGSALLASDLNKNSDYLLYSMQEVLDTVDAAAQDGALAAQVATEALRDEAEGFKNDAETAKNTTQGYLATVQSDATDADNHRIAASASEAAAATSEANAATSATNSANSATASATSAAASLASEQASAASETAAAASETAAAASETAAAASETAAAASATAAATSEANAAASFDDFDDRYLGAKATAPTVDNDGDALLAGALYWNTTNDTMYVWNGSAWDTFSSTAGIADGASSAVLTIDSNSRVGINEPSPVSGLQVSGNGSGNWLTLEETGTGDSVIDFRRSGARQAYVGVLGDQRLFINNQNSTDTVFNIGGSTKARLSNAGTWIVGNSTATENVVNDNVTGINLNNAGQGKFTSTNTPMYLNLALSGGNIQNFYRDGGAVGNIGVVDTDNLYIRGAAAHGGLAFGSYNVVPYVDGNYQNGTMDIGNPTIKFRNQYLAATNFVDQTDHRYERFSYGSGSFNCNSSWHYVFTGLNGHFNGQFTVSHSSGGVHTTGTFFVMITYASGAVFKFTSGSGYSQDIEMRITGSTYNYNIEIRTTTNYSGRTGYWKCKRFAT